MAHQAVFITGGTGYLGRRLIPLLLARGHRVRALVRPASISKAPAGCEAIPGDPFDRTTFGGSLAAGDTVVQLVGVPHPSPSKARQFVEVDLRSVPHRCVASGSYRGVDAYTARRLGLVTIDQMVRALVDAVEHPVVSRVIEVPEIRNSRI